MYSIILKFILAISIVSHRVSAFGLVGHYHGLVFVQKTPPASYYYMQQMLRHQPTLLQQGLSHMVQLRSTYTPDVWVIKELRSINSRGHPIRNCRDSEGNPLNYDSMMSDETINEFKEVLKTKWPSFYWNKNEENNWATHYNNYGSCISIYPDEYFNLAVGMLNKYEAGKIFKNDNIEPGSVHRLDRFVNALRSTIPTVPYLRCLPTENNNEQYLLEVQICYDSDKELKDCDYPATELCDVNKLTRYTVWPRR